MDCPNTDEPGGNFKITMEERKRYSSEMEVALLLELVEQHRAVVLAERTDHGMIRRKKEAWETITALYNAAGSGPPRSALQLKRMLEHQKNKAKRKNAVEKRKRMKTGGGQPPIPVEDPTHSKVLGLIDNELGPSNNKYDCDAVPNPMSSSFMQDVVPNSELCETGKFSVVDVGSCANDPSSQESQTLFVNESVTASTPCQTPTKFSPCAPNETQTPSLKESSAAGIGSSTRRLRRKKFSVQDECFQEYMKYRLKEHNIKMETKVLDKECSLQRMQWLKGKVELQKVRREKLENEIHLQKIKSVKVQNEVEAALAVIKTANAVTEHFKSD